VHVRTSENLKIVEMKQWGFVLKLGDVFNFNNFKISIVEGCTLFDCLIWSNKFSLLIVAHCYFSRRRAIKRTENFKSCECENICIVRIHSHNVQIMS
jgi:hypothetical protein